MPKKRPGLGDRFSARVEAENGPLGPDDLGERCQRAERATPDIDGTIAGAETHPPADHLDVLRFSVGICDEPSDLSWVMLEDIRVGHVDGVIASKHRTLAVLGLAAPRVLLRWAGEGVAQVRLQSPMLRPFAQKQTNLVGSKAWHGARAFHFNKYMIVVSSFVGSSVQSP
jgi:hypothetical protein